MHNDKTMINPMCDKEPLLSNGTFYNEHWESNRKSI